MPPALIAAESSAEQGEEAEGAPRAPDPGHSRYAQNDKARAAPRTTKCQ